MLAFISLFFPAVLSVWFYELLTKTEFQIKQFILRYCANVLFINIICTGIKRFVFNTGYHSLYDGKDMVPSVAFNYMVMAVIVAVVLVIVEIFLNKNIKVSVEEREDAQEK